MERDILFRGKRLSDGEWVKGSLIKQYDGRRFIFEPCGGTMYEVDPKTVGQYIDREDEAGQKIFEGDILNCEIEVASGFAEEEYKTMFIIGVVEYEIIGCEYMIRDSRGRLNPVFGYMDSIRKIGNIHDNPELMGGEKDG